MLTRIKYTTNGMGESKYFPQYRNRLGIWVTLRHYEWWDRVRTICDTEEEAGNAILERFEDSLRGKTIITGIVPPKGAE